MDTATTGSDAFSLLHPKIQDQLYQMRWTELRPIQAEAIHAIMETEKHLVISAMTAGGKTEAAFLPVLSKMADDLDGGVHALYVGPLKALINDQFRRLEELCQRTGIPVHKWHGDVSQSDKKALLKSPSGVLLITPESIESLFVNHPEQMPSIFACLSYAVIDEMHSFIGTERGAHMKSLLMRLSQMSTETVRLIALSATLGDIHAAARWMCPRDHGNLQIVRGDGEKAIKYVIRGYLRAPKQPTDTESVDAAPVEETEDDQRLASDIIDAFYGRTALVFANSKQRLEFYADLSSRTLDKRRQRNLFRVHHGSLSKAEREDTEEALRSDVPTTTFCSSTLELGIDVGNIAAIGQIGTPWSVSSLAQRLGRSGRRDGEASEMRVFIQEDKSAEHTHLVDRLYPELLQAIAMTELMKQKWSEPPDVDRLHLSTLIQQVMSIIVANGGATAMRLAVDLVEQGAFTNIDPKLLVQVLRSMGSSDLIEQTPEGELILGLKGERIVRSFDFYSAFATTEDLAVVHKGHKIGSVAALPGIAADTYLILAGRRWKIIEVDYERKEILVEPSRGGRLPYFSASLGADTHPRVRQLMRDILAGENEPVYLDSVAKQMLRDARAAVRDSGVATAPFVVDGPDTVWFTWTGSRVQRTLAAMGKHYGGLDVRDDDIALTFAKASPTDVAAAYLTICEDKPDAFDLASRLSAKTFEKYDQYLSDELQSLVFSQNHLDVRGAMSVIDEARFSRYCAAGPHGRVWNT